jgi:hypothetical protein
MCEMVDVKYEDVDFSAHNWFLEHTWTKEEEQEFCDWLVNEIRTNNKVRKELTTLPYRPAKYRAKKAVMWFNLNWGWKTELQL